MKTLKGLEKLAVDANPILSALIGGKARDVFLSEGISLFTTHFNFEEVEKYIPRLSTQRGLPIDDLYLALSMVPVIVCDEEFYKSQFKQASRLIGKRDPDDRHLLALALELQCPLWSNDRDFEGLGVKIYTTTDLIKLIRHS